MKSSLFLIFLAVVVTTPGFAAELWITPTVDPPDTTVGGWPVSSSTQTHFSFAIPDNFGSFLEAKVVVIGRNDKEATFDLYLSIGQDQNIIGQDEYLSPFLEIPVTLSRDQLAEVDISSAFPAEFYAGFDYVSVSIDTRFAQVLGLRFQYVDSGVESLGDDLEQEIADREAADRRLGSALTAEQSDRVAGDAALQEALDKEVADRSAADESLRSGLSDEESARIAGDAGLLGELTVEVAARVAADESLSSNLSAEQSARVAGDAALQEALTQEAADRSTADDSLRFDLDAEESARQGGDEVLQTHLGELSSALDAEESARVAGDAALQSQIDDTSCPTCPDCPGPKTKTFFLSVLKFNGAEVGSGPNVCFDGYHLADANELARIQEMEYADDVADAGLAEPEGFAMGFGGLDDDPWGWYDNPYWSYSTNCNDWGNPTEDEWTSTWASTDSHGSIIKMLNPLYFGDSSLHHYLTVEILSWPKLYEPCSSEHRVWCVSD